MINTVNNTERPTNIVDDIDLNLDIYNYQDKILSHVQQTDHLTHILKINITNKGENFILPNDTYVEIYWCKPDGTNIIEDSLTTESNNLTLDAKATYTVVTYKLTNNACAKSGVARFKLNFLKKIDKNPENPENIPNNKNNIVTEKIATCLGKIRIDGGVVDNSYIISTNEYKAAEQVTADARQATDNCEIITNSCGEATTACISATTNCTTATDKCKSATNLSKGATTACRTATDDCRTAITDCTTATGECEKATIKCNEAAEKFKHNPEGTACAEYYGNTYVSVGRKADTTVGLNSFAFGRETEAIGNYSHAEGTESKSYGDYSHAEGGRTESDGICSHTEGRNTTAFADYSHAEGRNTRSTGESSHAEGYNTESTGNYSHAEGNTTKSKGNYSHAEGCDTQANGVISHAEGCNTLAEGENAHTEGLNTLSTGWSSHAEGCGTKATGRISHAEGGDTEARGVNSHAGGSGTYATHFGYAIGTYNNMNERNEGMTDTSGDAFVIGNGCVNSSNKITRGNCFRVTFNGEAYGLRAFQSSGADYAEFIKPWADGNTDNEDRVGYFVTVKDGFLYKANEGDYITGITSGNPSIVGNADEDYYWRYERDGFNRIVMEDVPETVQLKDATGELVFDEETHKPVMVETGKIIKNARMKLSEDYDPSLQENYIERKNRKEWDYVGMLGVLPVRDDGTCVVGQFCKCGENGIATLATDRGFDTYMVLERISDNIVSVVLK